MLLLVYASVALVVTTILTPAIVPALLRLNIVDLPNVRSSHARPTPRGAGLAVAIGAIVAIVPRVELSNRPAIALLGAAAGFGLIGLIEDLRGISVAPRFLLQFLVTAAVLPSLLSGLGGPMAWRVVFTGGVIFWVLGYVNAYNFMDGINGISAAQSIAAGLTWFVLGETQDAPTLAVGGLCIAAAALGFAPFNFPKAKAFLGDVGSYFMGAWLAILLVIGLRAGIAPEAVVAPVLLYVADTSRTLVRRVLHGEQWHLPHKGHVYQRLTQLGWSHTRTTLFVFSVIVTCSGLGAASLGAALPLRVSADAAMVLVLGSYLASPRLVERAQRTAA